MDVCQAEQDTVFDALYDGDGPVGSDAASGEDAAVDLRRGKKAFVIPGCTIRKSEGAKKLRDCRAGVEAGTQQQLYGRWAASIAKHNVPSDAGHTKKIIVKLRAGKPHAQS
jgi:hypothetical protein